jgi:hypothetical protein
LCLRAQQAHHLGAAPNRPIVQRSHGTVAACVCRARQRGRGRRKPCAAPSCKPLCQLRLASDGACLRALLVKLVHCLCAGPSALIAVPINDVGVERSVGAPAMHVLLLPTTRVWAVRGAVQQPQVLGSRLCVVWHHGGLRATNVCVRTRSTGAVPDHNQQQQHGGEAKVGEAETHSTSGAHTAAHGHHGGLHAAEHQITHR